jgi:cytochrome P450
VRDVQRDPLGFLTLMTETYGDILSYRADRWTTVLVNRPDLVRHILQDHSKNYVKSGTPDMYMLKPMLGDGLLTSDGDTWVRQRRLAQPAFHRERIEAFVQLITDATAELLDRWRGLQDERLDLTDEMTGLTTRIVAQALFGVDISDAVGSFGHAVQAMNEFMGAFDPHDRAAYQKFVGAKTSIDALVRRIIQERRAAGGDRGDFLSMLLAVRDEETGEGLSDQMVRDQVMTLLMAGHETTAKALTWTQYLLHRHPEIFSRVRSHVSALLGGRTPTLADLPALAPVWSAIQEGMRLYPPVWIMSRMAVADDTIDGYHVPKGALVIVSPYSMHRRDDTFPDPLTFDPSRFTPEAAEARSVFAYLPFSAGPRQCIGKQFASLEMPLVLAMVIDRFAVTVEPDARVEPEALVTLRPKFGMPVRVKEIPHG